MAESATRLDRFYSNLWKTGISRPERFDVLILPPSKMAGSSQTIVKHLPFVCETVEIPSQTVATAEFKINGLPDVPIPYKFSFGNSINLSFKLSQDLRERNFLLTWQSKIYTPLGFSYYNDYVGTIIVKPVAMDNTTQHEFIFRNCFPVAIQELGYNWGDANNNLKQGVTFSFFSAEVRQNAEYKQQQTQVEQLLMGGLQSQLNFQLPNISLPPLLPPLNIF